MTKSRRKKDGSKDYAASLESASMVPNLDGDWLNFYLLIVLYIMQGFAIGLSGAFPIIFQDKKTVTYEDQANFSTALWPYCLKIFWAPVVDALYFKWFGRRKSWLIPLQTFMGLLLLYLANNIDEWLPEVGTPNLKMLTMVVFVINFLSATQDIVVDGWALTMLKKKNIGHASTCNSVGVPLGMLIGSVCFVLLVSENFWNTYFRTTPAIGGLITMKSFLYCAGIISLVVTVLIAVLKREKNIQLENGYIKIDVLQNYKLLWDILMLPRMKILVIALFTARTGFAAMDGVSKLKLIDAGVPKDSIMLITIVTYAIQFIMPVFVSKYTTSSKPMSYYLKITPTRLMFSFVYVLLIYFTPSLIRKNGVVVMSLYYYILMGAVQLINETMGFFMMLALYAFFCRLSDPRYGGTYMTIFNTFYYMGYLGSHTIVLKLVDFLTFSRCSNDSQNHCSVADLKRSCNAAGGNCVKYVDGFYVVIGTNVVIGFIWYGVFRNIIKNYESLSLSHWIINDKNSSPEELDEQCRINPI